MKSIITPFIVLPKLSIIYNILLQNRMKTNKKGKNVKKEKEIFRLPLPIRTKVGIAFRCFS